VLPNLCSAILRTLVAAFMFCAPELIFGGTEGSESIFQVLHSRTRFGQYRGPGSIFMFCSPELFFGGAESVRSHFLILLSRTRFSTIMMASDFVFMFCASRSVFSGTEDAGSRFNVLRFRTNFQPYQGRRVPFSCFAFPNSFFTISRASGPVFRLCAPGPVFGDTRGAGFCFHVLRSRVRFRRY
jgi:hypothetical protein